MAQHRPLADAGFEVIVPDLRGFGESGPAPDGFYDVAAQARDIEALVAASSATSRVVTCGGDLGGVVAQELARGSTASSSRQVLFNTIPPVGLGDAYEAAGVPVDPTPRTRMAADYFFRQANYADVVAASSTRPDKRRRYVATFYGPRFWAAPGTFDQRRRRVHGRAVRRRGLVPRVDRDLRVGARPRATCPRHPRGSARSRHADARSCTAPRTT